MEATLRPRVKICCILDEDEARLAVRHGAAALGLVSAMPSGPGVIDEETIARIARQVPPAVASFLLTSKQDVASIVEQQRRLRVNTLQLVDELSQGSHADLRQALPGVGIVQVVHVTGPESIDEAVATADHVDAILLDSGNPNLEVKQLGGTGRRHDWSISRRIREALPVPMFLAGGLNPDNVKDAVVEVGPYGLDICSGVRSSGRLDEARLVRFFEGLE